MRKCDVIITCVCVERLSACWFGFIARKMNSDWQGNACLFSLQFWKLLMRFVLNKISDLHRKSC